MKKWIKITLLVLAILAALFGLYLLILKLIPAKPSGENEFKKLSETEEHLEYNESNGLLYVDNEILVYVTEDAKQKEIDTLLSKYSAQIDDTMADIGLYRIVLPEEMSYDDLERIVDALNEEPIVSSAHIDLAIPVEQDDTAPDDFTYLEPRFPIDDWKNDAWNVAVPRGSNWGMEAINAPGAWAYLDQMSTVRVGLIDSMPDTQHDDLHFAKWTNVFVDSKTGAISTNTISVPAKEHGTHVSGIMAAGWDNGRGVSGVMATKGELYYAAVYTATNGRASDGYYTGYTYLLALKTLIDDDVQVINISQNTNRLLDFAATRGNENAIAYLTQEAEIAQNGLSRIIDRRQLTGKPDFLICVAAGNVNDRLFVEDPSSPYGYAFYKTQKSSASPTPKGGILSGDVDALYNNFLNLMDEPKVMDRVIVVGAVGINHTDSTPEETKYQYSAFSDIGQRVDIVAPGEEILSSVPGGYAPLTGTSMATPHVAGVAGLVFAANPELTGPEVKQILKSSAKGRFYYTDGYSGMLDAEASVVNALKAKESSVGRVINTSTSSGLDLCFIVDTTGSMKDDIDNAKENMERILGSLGEKSNSYRVALVDYRDFAERTDYDCDYPSRVQLDFSDDDEIITEAINDLEIGHGGDWEETVFSGIIEASKLSWRENAKKVIIILGDAPPLDPEPNTGYTYDSVIAALISANIGLDIDESDERAVEEFKSESINVYSIATSADEEVEDFFIAISDDTGGRFARTESADEVSEAIVSSIEQIVVNVDCEADFGEEAANQIIEFYDEEGFLFAKQTDENGVLTLEAVPVGTLSWKSNSVRSGGTLEIDPAEEHTKVKTSEQFGYASMTNTLRRHTFVMLLALGVFMILCAVVPLLMKRIPAKQSKQPAVRLSAPTPPPVFSQTCPRCNNPLPPSAGFCNRCGFSFALPAPAAPAAPTLTPAPSLTSAPKKMFCTSCGSRIESDGGFCVNCGAKLT